MNNAGRSIPGAKSGLNCSPWFESEILLRKTRRPAYAKQPATTLTPPCAAIDELPRVGAGHNN